MAMRMSSYSQRSNGGQQQAQTNTSNTQYVSKSRLGNDPIYEEEKDLEGNVINGEGTDSEEDYDEQDDWYEEEEKEAKNQVQRKPAEMMDSDDENEQD